ncbi:uncharacterized protein LOC111518354 [Drosophila willistoni]|uniref:uncharacterized protein LOC111518354 n=1 Tax=Drosophila willistoni TaxID=7260 RepID=UPI001F07D1EE|nr:uncharacterized protein LOC111518354 [Drosophila willistoni]
MHSRFPTIHSSTTIMGSKNNYKNFFDIHEHVNLPTSEIPRYVAEDAVHVVVENVFENDNCHAKRSDSFCDFDANEFDSVDPATADPRLVNWQRTLQRRKKIQQRIQRHTGKRAEDVLFNRQTTIDERNKQMLLRVLDNANRQNPTRVRNLKSGMSKLKPRCDLEMCREINELVATRPKPQQLEIVGLPEVTQMELASNKPGKESKWAASNALDEHLKQNVDDIKRVLEFAPDTDKLQVTSTWTRPTVKRMKKAFCYEENLKEISTDTDNDNEPYTEEKTPEPVLQPETSEQSSGVDLTMGGLKINGCLYSFRELVPRAFAEIQVTLQCDPHQRVVKTLLEIENLGPKVLCGMWQLRRMRAQKGSVIDTNLESFEFIFDNRNFSLEAGEIRHIDVMFRPQCVGLFKQSWCLYLSQSPFCGTRYLIIRVQGLCTMPVVYRMRLDDHLRHPIQSYENQMATKVSLQQADMAITLAEMKNSGPQCPYNRTLNELEIFNAQNPSYRCERYGDLESLKELYDLMKKPRQPNWDFQIETLQKLIMCQEGLIQRQTLQNRFIELLEPMKTGQQAEVHTLEFSREKDRTCLIYVTGGIKNTIDEWENMAMGLEQQFFKNEYQRQLVKQRKPETDELMEEVAPSLSNESTKDVDTEKVLKKVKGSKYFRDALYMQTYDLLCHAAENLVSIIESTGHG